MKNLTLKTLFTATSLLISSAFATTENTESSSSVWKVSKGNDVVYVGGTIHILPVSEFPLPEAFNMAYQNSDSIVLEANVPSPGDQEFQSKVMKTVAFTDGTTLADVVSDETYAMLNDYFAQFGMSVEQVSQFKPGFLQSMMLAMEAQRINMAGEGVDAYYSQVAKRHNKPIEYLESIDFQLNMLAEMGSKNTDEFFKKSIEDLPKLKESLQKLINAWRAGDVASINENVLEKMKDTAPEDFDMMITNRNIDWIPKIEKLFGDDDVEFVLVGVGHLVGDVSVLKMLSDKGYHIEKL